jgi:formate transporter
MTKEINTSEVFPPVEIARKVERLGVAKAHADSLSLLVLGILAGAFISLGALFFIVVVTDSSLGFGLTRLIGGLSFSLGLILVVIAGAELFTGNNLIAMAWASGLIGIREVMRNWGIVYVGNVLGCFGTVLLVLWCDIGGLAGGAVGEMAITIAVAKVDLSLLAAFARGILCNAFVCLAVWLAIGARSAADKVLVIIFPITAFVAIGLEHSIANWFFLPLGYFLDVQGGVSIIDAIVMNLVVTAGNILGGTVLVAGIYWLAYLRNERKDSTDDALDL